MRVSLKAFMFWYYNLISVRFWQNKKISSILRVFLVLFLYGLIPLFLLNALRYTEDFNLVVGLEGLFNEEPIMVLSVIFDQIAFLFVLGIFIYIHIILASIIQKNDHFLKRKAWFIESVLWIGYFSIILVSMILLLVFSDRYYWLGRYWEFNRSSMFGQMIRSLPFSDLALNLTDFYFFLLLLTFLLIFLIISILAYSFKNRSVIYELHESRLGIIQQNGLKALRDVISVEQTDSVMGISEIAKRSRLSEGETKWLLNTFAESFQGNWNITKQVFTVTENSSVQIDNVIDHLQSHKKQPSDQTIMYDILLQLKGIALPLERIRSRMKVDSEAEVFNVLNKEINSKGDYITRIDENFITIKSIKYNCQLCKKEMHSSPYWQCLQCLKYICKDDYEQLKQIGQTDPTCVDCGGMMIELPEHCKGCQTSYISVNQWRKQPKCPYCGYQIINKSSTTAKTPGLIEENEYAYEKK